MQVIVNVHAGDSPNGRSKVSTLHTALRGAGVDAQVVTPRREESLGDCATRLLDAGEETLVAAGGDGTIAALAGPCHAAGARLGILPMGTFNYFARAHGIPEDIDDAASTLLKAHDLPVALGTVNGRVFLNNVSIGLYPTILRAREDVYDRFGRSRAAAYWSVLKTLVQRPPSMKLHITLDGQEHRIKTPLAFVAASAYQLDEFDLEGLEDKDSGAFAVLIAPKVSRRALLRTAWRLSIGKAAKGPDYELREGHDISIQPKGATVLIACDGEKMKVDTPVHICRDARPLRLIAPKQDA